MDAMLQVFISWQFLMFGMAIAAIIYVFRKIVEFSFSSTMIQKGSKLWKLWTELILPISPVLFGVLIAVTFKTYPYPDGFTTEGDRIIFGLVAGLLSTLLYRIVKSFLVQKIQSIIPNSSASDDSSTDNVESVDPVVDGQNIINQVKQVIKQ